MSHFQQLLSHFQDRDVGLTETSILYENHVTLPSGLRTDRCESRLMSHMVEDQEAQVYDQSMQYVLCFFGVIIGAGLECVNTATLSSFYILIRSVSFL